MNQRVNKYRRHGKRFRARLRAVDILFEAETRDVDPMAIVSDRVELAVNPDNRVAPVDEYTRHIIDGVSLELDNLDDTIEKMLSESWELDRIPAVDRAILRVSVWELLYNSDVPAKTAVVEGVEMASHYGGDNASSYINGILDDVLKHRDEILADLQRVEEEAALAESSEDGDDFPEEASAEDSSHLEAVFTDDDQPTPASETTAPEVSDAQQVQHETESAPARMSIISESEPE